MYAIKRILVGLDFSAVDDTVINYVEKLCQVCPMERVYFIHIVKDLYMPPKDRLAIWNTQDPLDEIYRQKIEKKLADTSLKDAEILIVEGEPYEQMLHWLKIKEVDLVVIGRKYSLDGTGIFPQKLANSALASLLFVPEDAEFGFDRFLVTTDFTEHSRDALWQALWLSKEHPTTQIICHHSYDIPYGYSKTGKTWEEYSKKITETIHQKYNEWTASIGHTDRSIEPHFTIDPHKDIVEEVCDTAIELEADLIISVGRGRSKWADLFLKSTTKALVLHNNRIPMLIMKDKTHNLEFFETFQN